MYVCMCMCVCVYVYAYLYRSVSQFSITQINCICLPLIPTHKKGTLSVFSRLSQFLELCSILRPFSISSSLAFWCQMVHLTGDATGSFFFTGNMKTHGCGGCLQLRSALAGSLAPGNNELNRRAQKDKECMSMVLKQGCLFHNWAP